VSPREVYTFTPAVDDFDFSVQIEQQGPTMGEIMAAQLLGRPLPKTEQKVEAQAYPVRTFEIHRNGVPILKVTFSLEEDPENPAVPQARNKFEALPGWYALVDEARRKNIAIEQY
jgi:hypothetical protein